jgi:hypothetical protein
LVETAAEIFRLKLALRELEGKEDAHSEASRTQLAAKLAALEATLKIAQKQLKSD